MARLFTAASNEYGKNANAVVTSVPLTMACWARLTAVGTVARILMEVRNSASVTGRDCWSLRMSDTEKCRALAANATAASTADSTASMVAGTWEHCCAVFTNSTNFASWLNGTEAAVVSSARTPVGPNVTDIGIAEISSGSLSLPWNGDIAFPAVWNVALAGGDIAQLADAFAPPCVRPDALVAYWQLMGNSSPEPDVFGGYALTLTGTAKTSSGNPRIIEPRRSRMFSIPAAVGGLSIAVAMHQYRRLRAA